MKDLSLHILDLVENSLRAGASKVTIGVFEDTSSDTLQLLIKDNGRGMEEHVLKHVFDPFFTGQNKRKKIGLGLPLIKQLAEQCEGNVRLSSQKGKGTELIVTFKRSHIDLPPLGDIAETLVALIVANPEVEFEFVHNVDGVEWRFSSKELLEYLGVDNPEDLPAVLPAVKEWINFQEKSFREGGVNDEN
ncbi:MAG: hypothetical protein PWP60_32 [Candidatus Atribacteria bacterium]|nr:hypothetical protein [Candidatus Atribacteria bacterium]